MVSALLPKMLLVWSEAARMYINRKMDLVLCDAMLNPTKERGMHILLQDAQSHELALRKLVPISSSLTCQERLKQEGLQILPSSLFDKINPESSCVS